MIPRKGRLLLVPLVLGGAWIFMTLGVGRHLSRAARPEHGPVIHETTSDFSHIRIRERNGVRRLFFVDASGRERQQSAIDLRHPADLQLAYSRTMFASLLFRHPQEHVLIVGLGGGGMVRFLNATFPDTVVEAVEIDPAVVDIAERYFGTSAGPRTILHTADAFAFLAEPHPPFDAIYMDAFLKPPAGSGLDALTRRLKTADFLRQLRDRLKPDGVLAFNLIETDPATPEDLEAIRTVFPSAREFTVPGTANLVVIAPRAASRPDREELLARAATLEAGGETGGLPFREFVGWLRRESPRPLPP